MAVTATYTLQREIVSGSEKIMDWKVSLSGTYTTITGFAFTPATFGLDAIDFIDVMIDGSGANTNGTMIVLPNLSTNKFLLFATSASSGAPFLQVANPTLITGFQFIARVYGVA